MEKEIKIHMQKNHNERDIFKTIFVSARNCYNNDSINDLKDSYDLQKAINITKKLLKSQHNSIFEHIHFSFILENVSRSFMAQLSRHRIGLSLTVKSQHYINHKNFDYKPLETDNLESKILYKKTMNMLNSVYRILIADYNIPHYIAREVLPNATLCNIFVTVNLRELIHIFELRLGKENTPEIRLVFKKIFFELSVSHNLLFNLLNNQYNFSDKII